MRNHSKVVAYKKRILLIVFGTAIVGTSQETRDSASANFFRLRQVEGGGSDRAPVRAS